MICTKLTEQIVNFQVRDLSRITPSGQSHSGVNFAIHKTVLKSNINGGVKQDFLQIISLVGKLEVKVHFHDRLNHCS